MLTREQIVDNVQRQVITIDHIGEYPWCVGYKSLEIKLVAWADGFLIKYFVYQNKLNYIEEVFSSYDLIMAKEKYNSILKESSETNDNNII